jgi:hypothetical protein
MSWTIKRFSPRQTIVSKILSDGREIGLKAGSSVTWVVWNVEKNSPRIVDGKMDSFKLKAAAKMQSDFLNGIS